MAALRMVCWISTQKLSSRFWRESLANPASDSKRSNSAAHIHRPLETSDQVPQRPCPLTGDAAHIHLLLSAQGLNPGCGVVTNLGWKLAATVKRPKRPPQDLSLLHTYGAEWRPIVAKVLDWSLAQVATLQLDPIDAALQDLIRSIVETDDGA